jgi:hypothetical protein
MNSSERSGPLRLGLRFGPLLVHCWRAASLLLRICLRNRPSFVELLYCSLLAASWPASWLACLKQCPRGRWALAGQWGRIGRLCTEAYLDWALAEQAEDGALVVRAAPLVVLHNRSPRGRAPASLVAPLVALRTRRARGRAPRIKNFHSRRADLPLPSRT